MTKTKATVIRTDEKGRQSIIKQGLVARENSRGFFIWDPAAEGERPEIAEWFPKSSNRLKVRTEEVRV